MKISDSQGHPKKRYTHHNHTTPPASSLASETKPPQKNPLRGGLFCFRIMSQIVCNHPDCRRWWKRAFGANPKSCDEYNPPKLHLYQAPETSPPPSLSLSLPTSSNRPDNNDLKMTTRSSQETMNEANSPVRSANDMVRVSGSIYFWLRFVLHQFEFTLFFFFHSSPFFHFFRYDYLHGIMLQRASESSWRRRRTTVKVLWMR